jgi:U4/U6.U5 tri-snRNP-associated protein 2
MSQEGSAVTVKRKFEIKKLPKYLFLYIKRFSKNNFFKEKNCTIVNFPLQGLDLSDLVTETSEKNQNLKYDLIGNIIHSGNAQSGTYKA